MREYVDSGWSVARRRKIEERLHMAVALTKREGTKVGGFTRAYADDVDLLLRVIRGDFDGQVDEGE